MEGERHGEDRPPRIATHRAQEEARRERDRRGAAGEEHPVRELERQRTLQRRHGAVVAPVRRDPSQHLVVAGEGRVAGMGDDARQREVLRQVEQRQEAPGEERSGEGAEEGRPGAQLQPRLHGAGGPPMGWPTRTFTPGSSRAESAALPFSTTRMTVEPISKAPSSPPFTTGSGGA